MADPLSPADLGETGVPSISITEPVYTSPSASESTWVTCEAHFDPDQGVFVNFEAEKGWIIDEDLWEESEYEVRGETYSSLGPALAAAVKDTDHWPEGVGSDIDPKAVADSYPTELPQVLIVE